jgi:hypothetical protein
MVKTQFKFFVSGILVGLFVVLTMVPSSANTAYGTWSFVDSLNGYSYDIRNSISTTKVSGINQAVADTIVKEHSGNVIPSGYVGIFARMFNDSGQLVWESPQWDYIGSGKTSLTVRIVDVPASGARYSQGLHKTWHGTGYWTTATFASPSSSIYN